MFSNMLIHFFYFLQQTIEIQPQREKVNQQKVLIKMCKSVTVNVQLSSSSFIYQNQEYTLFLVWQI